MHDDPSSAGGPASTGGQDSDADLADLRRRYPGWDVRRGTDADPLGYSASRAGTLITSPSLDRLADLLAGANDGPDVTT